jgi:hypothetical protein
MQGEEQQYIKEKVKERYGMIALTGNSDCCYGQENAAAIITLVVILLL